MTSLVLTTFFRTAQIAAATFTTALLLWALPASAQTALSGMSEEALIAEATAQLQGDFVNGDLVFALGEITMYTSGSAALAAESNRAVVTVPAYQLFTVYTDFGDTLYVQFRDTEDRSRSGYVVKEQVARATQASRDLLVPATYRAAVVLADDTVTLMTAVDAGSVIGELPAGVQATVVRVSSGRVWLELENGKRFWTLLAHVRLGVVAVDAPEQESVGSFGMSDVAEIKHVTLQIHSSSFGFTAPQYVIALKNGQTVKVNVSSGASRSMVTAAIKKAGFTGNVEALLATVEYGTKPKFSDFDFADLGAANSPAAVSFTADDVALIVNQRIEYTIVSNPYSCPVNSCEMVYTVTLKDGTVMHTRITDADNATAFNDAKLVPALEALGLVGSAASLVDEVKRVIHSAHDYSVALQPEYTLDEVEYVALHRLPSNNVRYTAVTERDFILEFTPYPSIYFYQSGLREGTAVDLMQMAEFVDGENQYFTLEDIVRVDRSVSGNTVTHALVLSDGRVVHIARTVADPSNYQTGDYNLFRLSLLAHGYRGNGYTNDDAQKIVAMASAAAALPEETEPVVAEEVAVEEPVQESVVEEEVAETEVAEEAAVVETQPEPVAEEEDEAEYGLRDVDSITVKTIELSTARLVRDASSQVYTVTLKSGVVHTVTVPARTTSVQRTKLFRATGYTGSVSTLVKRATTEVVAETKPAETEPVRVPDTTEPIESEDIYNVINSLNEPTAYDYSDVKSFSVRNRFLSKEYTIVFTDGVQKSFRLGLKANQSALTAELRKVGYVGGVSGLLNKFGISVTGGTDTEPAATPTETQTTSPEPTIPLSQLESILRTQLDANTNQAETSSNNTQTNQIDITTIRRLFGFVQGDSVSAEDVLDEFLNRLVAWR